MQQKYITETSFNSKISFSAWLRISLWPLWVITHSGHKDIRTSSCNTNSIIDAKSIPITINAFNCASVLPTRVRLSEALISGNFDPHYGDVLLYRYYVIESRVNLITHNCSDLLLAFTLCFITLNTMALFITSSLGLSAFLFRFLNFIDHVGTNKWLSCNLITIRKRCFFLNPYAHT